MKRRNGYREIIPAIKGSNQAIITDSTGKSNNLNSYYASVFCCDHKTPKIQLAKKVTKNREKKSVGPDGVPGEIMKLGGEAKTSFLTRLQKILNNATLPSD